MKKYIVLFLGLIYGALVFSQDINVMSYNVLLYPEGDMVNRIDTFSKILDYYKPDLLLLQELKSEQGLQNVTEELTTLFGNFASGTYVNQVSNPSNTWRLQQNIAFNENVFSLDSERVIETLYRDINYFKLNVLDDNAAPTSELVHVYVTHLKSSQGNANEQLRLAMAEVLIDSIALLPAESNVIVAGDFNVYYGQEPAYEMLLSTNGTNTLNDPIDMPGWGSSNFQNKEVYTQSTRLSSLSDGAGGGVDDRFDFILLSDHLMNSNSDLTYQSNSYKALGNNGTCYNEDLIDCTTTDNVPYDILRSLYYMSDHLPVVLSLDKNNVVSAPESSVLLEDNLVKITPNPANTYLDFVWDNVRHMDLSIFSLQGKLMLNKRLLSGNAKLDITNLNEGLYFVEVKDVQTGEVVTKKIVVQR